MRVAAVAIVVLALAGCTLQHGFITSRPTGTTDLEDYAVRPVARFPTYDSGCQEMPDGSCDLRPSVASTGPAAQAPRRIASAPNTVQPASAPSPVVASVPPPVEAPASKPDGDDRKVADKTADDGLTDTAIVALIIQASREAYYSAGHSCPCPYDLAPNGRLCGRHSAHSRPGASMRCFAADVTADQIANYRAKLASKITASWSATGNTDAVE
jgi:hypothetical protein